MAPLFILMSLHPLPLQTMPDTAHHLALETPAQPGLVALSRRLGAFRLDVRPVASYRLDRRCSCLSRRSLQGPQAPGRNPKS